jgi:glycosyltransferase involved in cell wall biosynthesis
MLPRMLAVVPVYNGQPPVVVATVKSILKQDYPELRIVIIDDHSEEPLHKLLLDEFSNFPKVTVLRNDENLGFAENLNKGLTLVRDETYLFVLEQDCELLSTNYISRALNHFTDERVGVVSGENLLPPLKELSLTKKVFVNHLCEDVHDDTVVEVGFSLLKADIFRTDLLKKIGGFESSAKWKFASEEHIVSYKIRSLGYKIIKDSNLRFRAYFARQESLWQNLHKEALYGRGLGWALARMQSDLKTGESKQLKSKKNSRIVEAQYVFITIISLFIALFSLLLALILVCLSSSILLAYLVRKMSVCGTAEEKLLFILTGFLRSWVYIPSFFFGYLYGLVLRLKERNRTFLQGSSL